MTSKTGKYLGAASVLALAISMAAAGGAAAQVSTATLRGTVYEGPSAETGGTVVATEVATGYVSRGRIAADGGYVLPGLRPGTYRVLVTSADGQTAEDTVTIVLGQVATLDLDVAPVVTGSTDAGATELGDVVVTGRRIFEVRTSEVATNVSQQQINDLPQISRNFLNFAALAPGVRVQEGDTERTISAGGQPSMAVNVFIDGQNQKSLINDGGIAGQDDSRGNPFPQAAVQEFRVLTQNFKAEYEQASSAIITSVTRSGTNEFAGDFFVTYQPSNWVGRNVFLPSSSARPRLDRMQYGGSIGGPIIEDKLHFFFTYERKDETRERSVFLNRTEYNPLFASELGTFEAPFEQDLFFGKLSWSIDDRQRLDLSATYRTEQDIRDFGNGATAYARAQAINVEYRSLNLRHQFQGDGFLNEVSVDYLESQYNPQALNFNQSGARFVEYGDASTGVGGLPGFQFGYGTIASTIFTNGGGTNNQDLTQEVLTFRDDLTFSDIDWMGTHTLKMGVKYSMQTLYVYKQFNRNPFFTYDVDARPEVNGTRTIPTQVSLNLPVDPVDAENNVFGAYIQDDWQITDKLEVNLGLRWDYEDNAVNNDWRTPDVVRRLLTAIDGVAGFDFPSYLDINDYISDGKRDAFKDAWQPRIGFSYDVFGDERTVIFGGAGRYYDRIAFNFAFDERFKPYQLNKTIYFSPAGGSYGGRTDTVAWNPIYATPAGLDTLLAGTVGRGEVFLIKDDAPPPLTDQFNIGVRQKFGDWQTAVTFSWAKTKNEFGWYRANIDPTNNQVPAAVRPSALIDPVTGLAFNFNDGVFVSNHDRERDYQAIFITADKPFTRDSGWGFNLAYTFTEATQNGSRDQGTGNFDFDYPWTSYTPEFNSPGAERHRLVMSGTVQLPYDFRLSTLITLGSGLPFTKFNPGSGAKPGWFEAYPDKKDFIIPNAWAYRQVDLRIAKEIELPNGDFVELTFDAINVLDFKNFSSFNQTYRINNNTPDSALNPTFGRPTAQFLPTRSFQVGLRYRW
ncbi:TonB-dependent receptor [Brevundimonas sp.]|uniref:TonB-dependent receptor n=1 Tax=Brevundimonas sp. TaxID=1871086 RepID=UPI0025BC63E6|nr:TonB-dependent receptor [Brevundimonas sp.]